jgi:hypothetical protein
MLENRAAGFGGSVALLALATVACAGSDGEDEGYRYSAAEVEQLVVGSWAGTWTDISGAPASRLAMEVSRLPAQRAACGTRELGEGSGHAGAPFAPQCVSSSHMQLQASLTVDGAFSDLPLSGGVWIRSLVLSGASLSLSGTGHALSAEWLDGSWQECRVQRPDGALVAECTLERAP